MSDIDDDPKDEDSSSSRQGLKDREPGAIVKAIPKKEKKTRTRRDSSPDTRVFPLHDDYDDDSGSDRDSTSDEEDKERERMRRRRRHKRRKERRASPQKAKFVPLEPVQQQQQQPPPVHNGSVWDFLVNLAAMTVFAIALSLYVMPGIMTPILLGVTQSAPAATASFHPEWPLHTFETAGARYRTTNHGGGGKSAAKKAVQSDATFYKKVIDTLSYHVIRDPNKRVLCMWHLQQPVSISVANVCVWKRRPPGISIFSLGEPIVEEGMLLPMFNLDIKGYATNVSKV